MKHVTLLFLRRDNQILLAMKKRGFGINKWNGVGGKLDEGETREQAAVRECQEEIDVTPRNMTLVGEIDFRDLPDVHHYCHVYTATEWEGEPTETEEMRPEWFDLDKIPYKSMWPDDELWLPKLLEDKLFTAEIIINPDDTVQKCEIAEVESL
jgi:mutator protein MutT